MFLITVIDLREEPPPTDSGANQSQDNVLKKVRVPLAGDLLGRERVTGAKKTRLGCDNIVERFKNIVECPALWHVKQSFLSVSWICTGYLYIVKLSDIQMKLHEGLPTSLELIHLFSIWHSFIMHYWGMR